MELLAEYCGWYCEGPVAHSPGQRSAIESNPDRDSAGSEDSYNGVRSAFAAGMMTIMVPDLLEPTVEIRDLCVHVSQDLHEVRRLILR